jgi:hypothetical protein
MALLDQKAEPSPQGWALASGTLLAALMTRLVDNHVITETDASAIVASAKVGLNRFSGHIAYADAIAFLDALAWKLTS